MKPELKNAFESLNQALNSNSLIDLAKSLEYSKSDALNLKALLEKHKKNLSPEDAERLDQEYLSFGPLQSLFKDEDITEIIINSHESIWFEKRGHFYKHKDQFFSALNYENFISRLCIMSNMQINLDRPCNNGDWNNFRIHIVRPPLSHSSTQITLRRHPKNPWTFESLKSQGWANDENIQFILKCIQEGKNFLVIGPTGSGKTSILNACLQTLPQNERVICIEDTSELALPNLLSSKLLTREDPQKILKDYSQTDLLKEALRMRPHRLIMGEIRGSEAKDFILALSTGHHGCMGSMHSNNPQQALWRLELLIQLGAPYWSVESIRGLIKLGLDYIIQTECEKGKRYLKGIYQITSLEKFGFLLEPVHK